MRNKNIIFVFFIFFIFLLNVSITNATHRGAAFIVIDYDTNNVLFHKNADTLNYPASLTKMMTLYIIFDHLKKNKLDWDTNMRVSKIAASRSPSKIYLEEGSYISVEDAVMALIIKSANDVATVVAEHISQSEREFAKLMTNYSKQIGMKKTTFKNASGLPHSAQMTTARDIAILSKSLIKNFPEKYKLFSERQFTWKGKTYKTHNKLMLNYEGADGIKTGYIKASGFQLAFSAKREGKRLVGVYFGGDSGAKRDKSLTIIMNKSFKKLNITKIDDKKDNNSEKNLISNNKYKIVVGTFKYKKNAEKHLKLIKKKYPKTTYDKKAYVALIKSNGKQLYESRFKFFSKKEAKTACSRLKKYKRDCFIRG